GATIRTLPRHSLQTFPRGLSLVACRLSLVACRLSLAACVTIIALTEMRRRRIAKNCAQPMPAIA
ncbi:hypothetical protein, partial [Burkholderia stabilis]|uniref:hypothetical protein n=1 Tax=Burkholderia stabilis TaxID=95485 RepID=UPI001F4BBE11